MRPSERAGRSKAGPTRYGDLHDRRHRRPTRRREIATEHLLFRTIDYVEARHPGLLDHLEASLDHLGDPGPEDKDDEAVRTIARRMIAGARAAGAR